MRDEEISRRIAEHLEPMPTAPKRRGQSARSPGGAWIAYTGGWQARDFSDPAMTVMLMERPGFVSINLIDGEYIAEFCGATEHSEDCFSEMRHVSDKHLGRAVALAYLDAHGLGGE